MSGPAFITGWALETNYPSSGNAWGSQPCKVLPVGDIFTPGQPIPAEWLNYLFNQQSAAIISQQVSALLPSVQNWYSAQSISVFTEPSTLSSIMAACWDPLTNVWLLLIGDAISHGYAVAATSGLDGNGQTFWTYLSTEQSTSGFETNFAICADATTPGNCWVAYPSTASSGNVTTYVWNGSTWGAETSFFNGLQLPFAGGTALTCQLHTFNGYNLCAIGAVSAAGALVVTTAGVGLISFPSTTQVCGTILMADNSGNGGPSNLMLAVPTYANSTLTYWTSPDGVTFTARTLFIGTIRNVFGIVWTQDAVGPCWLLGVTTVFGNIQFYRSSDGITWTPQGSTVGFGAAGTGLASPGDSRIFATTLDASDGGPSAAAYSIDGGVTWYRSQATFASNNAAASAPYKIFSEVVASSAAFMTFNSLFFRFSATAGLPPNHL